MFKKLFFAALTLFVVAGVGFGGFMWAGKASGEAKLREFFAMGKRDSLSQIEAQLSDHLKERVDPELGAAYVKAISTEFGDFASVNLNGLEFSDKLDGSSRLREYKGTFVFAKREVPIHVQFIDERLAALTIVDDPIGPELIKSLDRVPANTEAYQRGGERFLTAVLNGKGDDAFEMLGENLQKQVGRQGFEAHLKEVAGLKGLKRVEVVSAAPRPNAPDHLDVAYRCVCPNGVLKARVTFQFAGLKPYLMGFKYETE